MGIRSGCCRTDCESVQRCYRRHRGNAEIASWCYSRTRNRWGGRCSWWRRTSCNRSRRSCCLFTNPWILGIGAVSLAAVGVGTAIYNEMPKEDKAHEAAIDATKGKYEEWYNAVMMARKGCRIPATDPGLSKEYGETYAEAIGTNQSVRTTMPLPLWKMIGTDIRNCRWC